ncbi:MAG: hypothetical protein IJN92_10735 [Lachnospiraceae bacterium]|nr:hypothetical protein [Lachnospiraceae bacterium]
MNIVILTNLKQYPYHLTLANMINSLLSQPEYTISKLDINSEKYDHKCLAKLKSLNPNVLITLDLAGFRFPTQSGEIALNMLYTKNLNLIWGNKPEYAPFLNKKISLSMQFFDVSGIDNNLPLIFPNLLYYNVPGILSTNFSLEQELSKNKEVFIKIWQDFLKEALLLEA